MTEFQTAILAAYAAYAPPPVGGVGAGHPVDEAERPGVEAYAARRAGGHALRYRVRWTERNRTYAATFPATDDGLAEALACRAAHPMKRVRRG